MSGWVKLIVNAVAAVGVCFGAHSIAAGSVTAAATSAHAWLDAALCVAMNLAGLVQHPPKTAP